MQVLVLYYSRTGNTRDLAAHVAEGVNQVEGVEVVTRSTEEVGKDDFLQSDAIIAGSPVYFGTMAWPLKKVLDDYVGLRRKMEDKIGAAFATSGDASGGKETTMMSIHQAWFIYGMIVVGDPLAATGHYGTSCIGQPGPTDAENAVLLGKRVAELAKKLRG